MEKRQWEAYHALRQIAKKEGISVQQVILDIEEAITEVLSAIETYDPTLLGYAWDKANPRIQLEPIGTRGYIELLPVKDIG